MNVATLRKFKPTLDEVTVSEHNHVLESLRHIKPIVAKMPGVVVHIENITPELAREYLKLNLRNQKIKGERVDKYASDMLAGRWHFTGDAIQVSDTGVLLNGQHRLYAIIQSGTNQQFTVIRGIPMEHQAFIDQQPARPVEGQLNIVEGYGKMAKATAAAALLHLQYRSSIIRGTLSTPGFSKAEMFEYARDARGIGRPPMEDLPKMPKGLTGGLIYGLYSLVTKVDSKAANEILDTLASGVQKYEGDPIFRFREAVIAGKLGAHFTRATELRLRAFMMLVNASNLYRRKQAMAVVKKIGTPVLVDGLKLDDKEEFFVPA